MSEGAKRRKHFTTSPASSLECCRVTHGPLNACQRVRNPIGLKIQAPLVGTFHEEVTQRFLQCSGGGVLSVLIQAVGVDIQEDVAACEASGNRYYDVRVFHAFSFKVSRESSVDLGLKSCNSARDAGRETHPHSTE